MKLPVWSATPSGTVWSSPDGTEGFFLAVSQPFYPQNGCFSGLDSPAQSSILTAVEGCLRGHGPHLRHPNVNLSLTRRQLELGKRILRNFRRSSPYSRKSGIHSGFRPRFGTGGQASQPAAALPSVRTSVLGYFPLGIRAFSLLFSTTGRAIRCVVVDGDCRPERALVSSRCRWKSLELSVRY